MSSRAANRIALDFHSKLMRLDSTRQRIEQACHAGSLHQVDVEASYTGLFLQAVVAYESTIEAFVLGLMVRPGGIASSNRAVRARVSVRSYAHALELACGPGRKYPSWIGEKDLTDTATLVLQRGKPFVREAQEPSLSWHYIKQCGYIRNAIAHPSGHAIRQFEKHVLQSTPLPRRERTVAGFLRGRGTGSTQTRWEVYVAGLNQFVSNVVA